MFFVSVRIGFSSAAILCWHIRERSLIAVDMLFTVGEGIALPSSRTLERELSKNSDEVAEQVSEGGIVEDSSGLGRLRETVVTKAAEQ
jgi:hypothetical protein